MGLEIFERGALPRWQQVGQELDRTHIADVARAVKAAFAQPGIGERIAPGMRVAIGVGSRGIDRLAEVVRSVVQQVRARGGEPFIVPAMGSHGGATSGGQQAVLAEYGVTENGVGAPVRSFMETVLLGEPGGLPLHFDRLAAQEADAIIPINRVKPHTDFHASIESGLTKMIVIGMGKQRGADALHSRGFARFGELLPHAAEWLLERLPIPFGIALVENGLCGLAQIEAVAASGWVVRERELLEAARRRMAHLPGERIDVLIIDRIGKDISGIGADTNVIGRYYTGPLPVTPAVGRIVIRDLSAATEGNASGLGLADVALEAAVAKMDRAKTYMNCITAKTPEGARIPITVGSDREAVYVALACCLEVQPETAAIVRIRDTKTLERFWASEAYAAPLVVGGQLQALSPPEAMGFDARGMFTAGGERP